MTSFEWDENKNQINQRQYGVSFEEAQYAFFDEKRLITKDEKHSINEQRLFCIGKIDSGIITVRFTYRKEKIRIIGAGYWRKGKKLYEQHYK